jgi:hypothetical protein
MSLLQVIMLKVKLPFPYILFAMWGGCLCCFSNNFSVYEEINVTPDPEILHVTSTKWDVSN